MWVKVCGVTREEDARLAADCGATAIGFVFWPHSPRFVAPAEARDIRMALPGSIVTVGVFVNQEVGEVEAIARYVGLHAVQLHGDEAAHDFARLGLPLIAVVPPGVSHEQIARRFAPEVLVLVDAADPTLRGGTGRLADWEAARTIAARRATVLAGGLTPWNVAEAIAAVHPFGVDVSSGVEAAPGRKDADLVKRFVAAAIAAGGETRP